ncbi:hypothetical protein [Ramlibacter tataouinensis]|uniref:hypothetical protein n=1 Tax=Ramlibacter tataouinensis TaxID=94132 RepID=UPI00117DAAF3|nr:hypothetical protein [Ramlibacter tataouinensis]
MIELNAVTAVPVGAFAAAVWAAISIRRFLRSGRFASLSRKQKLVVWGVSAVAFGPALLLAFAGSMMLTNVTVRPGPGNHLAMALTMALGLGFFGAAITWAAARIAATLLNRQKVST